MSITTHPAGISAFQAARLLKIATDSRLTPPGLHLLCVISAAGDDFLTMTAIARAMGVLPATVTGIADTLESRGLITRRASRKDRRIIWLELTERGRVTLHEVLTCH